MVRLLFKCDGHKEMWGEDQDHYWIEWSDCCLNVMGIKKCRVKIKTIIGQNGKIAVKCDGHKEM